MKLVIKISVSRQVVSEVFICLLSCSAIGFDATRTSTIAATASVCSGLKFCERGSELVDSSTIF